MYQYLNLVEDVLKNGVQQEDRTGTGTLAVFGRQLRFKTETSFPLLTTKQLPFRVIAEELFWMMRGETNIKSLQERNVHIWDEWADENGDLGPVYGAQWRTWWTGENCIDQLSELVDQIKNNPASRRQIVTAWNPGEIEEMALPPCHCFFQTVVYNGILHLQVYQRSCDLFLGVPFNIASYALLLRILAYTCGLRPGELIWTGGDIHLYKNHIKQAQLQLTREPRRLPTLQFAKNFPGREPPGLSYWSMEEFQLNNYQPWPHIPGEVSV